VVLSDLSIRKPVFAWMIMFGLLVFGGIGGWRLGVSQMPDIDFPQVSVALALEGAAPEVMETDVLDVVEDALMTVEGIREITSSCRQGAATVTVEFFVGRDIDAALQDVQTKIGQAQRRLPREMDPPIVTKTNPEDQPILWVGVSGTRSPQVISDLARFLVKEQLQTIAGVGEVMMGGYRERNLRVWLDADRLDAYDLAAGDVIAAIKTQHLELPAGRIESGARESNVRMLGEAIDLADFRKLVVVERAGATITVGDLGVVEDGLEDRRRAARAMGLPAQGLGVKKQRGANAVQVAHAIRDKLAVIRRMLPEGVSVEVNFDATVSVEEAVHEIEFTLILAVFLTALVCWLFLGSISSTVNVLLAIPTSIIGTFGVMYFCGFTLNTFTLLALSLSVGIVVDDAIMVLENIYRHAEEGAPRIRAAVVGTREISFAAIAATAAIAAIFLPVAFMKGIIGAFFFQFGVTISVCVLLSLLEALTLTPSRCAQFLSVGGERSWIGRLSDRAFALLARGYRASLRPALRWRWAVVVLALALFGASLKIIFLLRMEMTPPTDVGCYLTRISTPVGSSIDTTDRVMRECEAILAGHSEVRRYFGAVGGFGGGEVTTAVLFVTLVPAGERARTLQQFMDVVRGEMGKIPGAKVALQDLSLQGFTAGRGYPVEFSVIGPAWEKLGALSETITERMRETGLYLDADSNYLVGMPEVRLVPDRDRAAALGVSMEDIGQAVNVLVGGVRAGKFKDRGRQFDIRVRLLSGQRSRPENIDTLRVRTRSGELVPLSSLVRVDTRPSLQSITRRNRERAVNVFANVAPGKSQAEAIDRAVAIATEVLPEGYHVLLSGSAQTMKEAIWEFGFALLLGVVIAYMILAAQFNSFLHPFTILMAMPFSLTGALVALWWAGLSLNVYSLMGLILLMGIVKKNSILLVDFTNQRRLLGESRDEALLHACPMRLRPILMTSVSTIVGALPAALAAGPGGELRQSMAVAVVGGLAVSTLLTLYVVPAVYSLFDFLTTKVESGPRIERETLSVLASLQSEEIERFRR